VALKVNAPTLSPALEFALQAYVCHHVGMRNEAKSTQYTIRGIPPSVDRALRKLAGKQSKSLNRVLLEAVSAAAGLECEAELNHDLDGFINTWIPDRKTEAALVEQRKVDLKDWK
jgi:hypothetical protein